MGGPPPHRADLPKTEISWADAVQFCNRLSEREGLEPCYAIEKNKVRWLRDRDGYRLPTEAEWEYAARAGTRTAFSFGDAPKDLDAHAWFGENSGGSVHPVGQKRPNRWGLHDVHGNVWEWVWDRYAAYDPSPARNPTGPDGNNPAEVDGNVDDRPLGRVLRGGAFNFTPVDLRSANRLRLGPTVRFRFSGLRVARGPHSRI